VERGRGDVGGLRARDVNFAGRIKSLIGRFCSGMQLGYGNVEIQLSALYVNKTNFDVK
jgi:hypothetical protein